MAAHISQVHAGKEFSSVITNILQISFPLLGCKTLVLLALSHSSRGKFSKKDGDLLFVLTIYQKHVGRLVYLTIIRIDIPYDIHIVSEFLTNPFYPYLAVVKYGLFMISRAQSRPSPSISSSSSELVPTMLGSAVVILFHHSSLSWARSSNRFALLQVYPYYFQSMPSSAYPFSLRAQKVHSILRFFFFPF